MTVGFIFFTATDFSPLCLQRCHHSTEKWTDPAPSIIKYFITRKGSWDMGDQDLSFGVEHQARIPHLTGATWARTEVTVTKNRPSRWRSVLPTGVPPQLLSTPPNHHPVRQQKNPMLTGLPNSCALIQMRGLTWAEQKNVKYFVVCAVKQIIPPSISYNSEMMSQK